MTPSAYDDPSKSAVLAVVVSFVAGAVSVVGLPLAALTTKLLISACACLGLREAEVDIA